jgi:Mn-dependent DtxR family transcriptional regulator
MTMVNRYRLKELVIEQVKSGYTTSKEITSNLKISQPKASFIFNLLIDDGCLVREKVNGVLRYSLARNKLLPAHDPFGLCHGYVTKSYETPSRIHRLNE